MAALLLGGCYHAVGAGYARRFAKTGGDSFEGSYTLAMGEVIGEDAPTMFGKATIMGGSWGIRAADVFGAILQEDLDGASFFLKPGLALLVIGTESQPGDDELWVGIGAEMDVGFLIPLGDKTALEIGARTGGDLSYTGTGSGGFVGAFIAIGWVVEGPSLYTR